MPDGRPGARRPGPETRLADRRAPLRRLGSIGRVDEIGVLAALLVLVLLIGGFHPQFWRSSNLLGTLQTASFVGIVSYGMVFLLAMTEIDLSVGGTYATSIIVAGKLMAEHGWNPWLAACAGVVVGLVMGALNGVLAASFKLPLIIITLGTLSAYRGAVTVISNAQPVQGLPVTTSFFTVLGTDWLGVPVSAWVAVVLGVVLTVVFTKTRFGLQIRAIGSNRNAAAFTGIPLQRIQLYAIMLVGGLAGLSGVLSLAYFQGADPTIGTGLELQVIAAAIIGGTAISGGTGTVPGALLGACIVAVINGGLVFFSIPTTWTDLVTGVVILLAVATDAVLRRRRLRSALGSA